MREARKLRSKLMAEADKCKALGAKIYNEGHRMFHAEPARGMTARHVLRVVESDKVMAEGNKIYADGCRLKAEANLIWIKAWIVIHGPDSAVDWEDEQ